MSSILNFLKESCLLILLFTMHRNMREGAAGQNQIKFRKVKKLRSSHSQSNLQSSQLSQSRFMSPPRLQLETNNDSNSKQCTPQLSSLSLIPSSEQELNQSLARSQHQHHDDKKCLCQNCNCGRHLCNFAVQKPEFIQKRSTSYSREFVQKKAVRSLILVARQVPTFKSDSFLFQSKYSQEFKPANSSPVKNQPVKYSDHLKLEGPSHKTTTYSEEFVPHKGINQYVKPTNRCKIGNFPLDSRTTYSKQFTAKKASRTQSLKQLSELKMGKKMWMGQTVYQMKFQNPNPEDYPRINPLVSKSQKFLKSPEFLSRFTTSYGKEFYKKESTLCPAKKDIASNININFKQLRSLLNERGDQRGLNPHFRAIATSKHFFV